MNVTGRSVCERKPVGDRMSRVFEVDRFVSLRTDPDDTGGGDVDRAGGTDRPFVPLPVEMNRGRLHAEECSNETGQGCHGSAGGTAGDRVDRVSLLLVRAFVDQYAEFPVAVAHDSRRAGDDDES